MTPTRIQRKRAKGYRQPGSTKYCGRGTKYGNPYKVSDGLTVEECCRRYEECVKYPHMAYCYFDEIEASLMFEHFKYISENIEELRQYKYLSCFCPLDHECHVDRLILMLSE
jgi:hypothetical protein